MPDDHSKLAPLLPIPNRTVKQLRADDSADTRVKVGHRQAFIARNVQLLAGRFLFTLFEVKRKRASVTVLLKTVLQYEASLITAGLRKDL